MIDKNRMANHKPVIFSTWGEKYTEPLEYEDKTEEVSNNSENKDYIDVNNVWSLRIEEYLTRSEEIDLVYENKFLQEIAKRNDLEISRQFKTYTPEYEGQKYDEYSKFQENCITYLFEDNRDFYVELRFSENEILGKWKENENTTFKDSVIQNVKVHIFEWKVPEDNLQNYCRAQFTIDGMNFVITTYNMSHEEFIKMIKTTIEEYEKFENLKEEIAEVKKAIEDGKLEISLTEIIISDDGQKIAYRKDASSLYVSNVDGSNEMLLLKSIDEGEDQETRVYIPQRFIDNNKIAYTCIGWEQEKGCGIIEIDTGRNVYYENKNGVRYYYDEDEKTIMPIAVE